LLTEFGSNVDKYLIKKTTEDDRDYSYIHPSSFGGCLVHTWLQTMGEKPLVPQQAIKTRLFDNGHYVHLRNQIYAKESGMLAKDKIIKKYEPDDILIGLEPKTKVKIEGESGRIYYYSPGEIIWRVDRKKSKTNLDIYIGTDNAPYWDTIDNLKEGDEWWMIEVPVLDTTYHFGGHVDAVIINDGIETVINYKGINDYSWPYIYFDKKKKYMTRFPDNYNSSCFICGDNMKKAKEFCNHLVTQHINDIVLDFKYKVQLHIYMMILNLNQALLWYENKNNQIVLDYLVQRDDNLIEKIQNNSLKFWNKVINKERPSRQPDYKRTTLPCSYCDYAFQCWNN